MANLLALDQASITTGYAIFKDGKYSSHGKFSFDDHDIGMRLVKIRNKVLELIRENDITEIAFEDIQYQERVMNNVQTFKTLAEVYGVIQEVAGVKNPNKITDNVVAVAVLNKIRELVV